MVAVGEVDVDDDREPVGIGDEKGVELEEGAMVGPPIDEEAGAILDRLAEAHEQREKRSQQSATMNDRIRKAFGKGG
jgi:hypothetical protein